MRRPRTRATGPRAHAGWRRCSLRTWTGVPGWSPARPRAASAGPGARRGLQRAALGHGATRRARVASARAPSSCGEPADAVNTCGDGSPRHCSMNLPISVANASCVSTVSTTRTPGPVSTSAGMAANAPAAQPRAEGCQSFDHAPATAFNGCSRQRARAAMEAISSLIPTPCASATISRVHPRTMPGRENPPHMNWRSRGHARSGSSRTGESADRVRDQRTVVRPATYSTLIGGPHHRDRAQFRFLGVQDVRGDIEQNALRAAFMVVLLGFPQLDLSRAMTPCAAVR
jgi:hypothetical protein